MSIEDAYTTITAWQHEYNAERPRSALDYRSPHEFIEELQGEATTAA